MTVQHNMKAYIHQNHVVVSVDADRFKIVSSLNNTCDFIFTFEPPPVPEGQEPDRKAQGTVDVQIMNLRFDNTSPEAVWVVVNGAIQHAQKKVKRPFNKVVVSVFGVQDLTAVIEAALVPELFVRDVDVFVGSCIFRRTYVFETT